MAFSNESKLEERPVLPMLTGLAVLWCVIVFLGVNYLPQNWTTFGKLGYLTESSIFNGAYWGLATSAFVHVQPMHLIFNLYWLWALGSALERSVSSLSWLAIVVGSAFVSAGWQLYGGQAGIGMSGVVYAVFGFGLATRAVFPEFSVIVNQRTATVFLVWGLFCIVATYANWMQIANGAHVSGFLFGWTLGGLVASDKYRVWFGAAALVLAMGSVGSVFYNPFSPEWVSKQAYSALGRGQFKTAERWLKRGLELGDDPRSTWRTLARVYILSKDEVGFANAVAHLEAIDPDAAEEVVKQHSVPRD